MPKKLTEQELQQMLFEARKLVDVDSYYTHYKGNTYQVLEVAILTEELGVGVIYQAQYGEKILFVRPLKVWLEEVEHNGRMVKRFVKV